MRDKNNNLKHINQAEFHLLRKNNPNQMQQPQQQIISHKNYCSNNRINRPNDLFFIR